MFAAADDKDFALAVLQAYNDWHVDEWCGAYPGRFIPMGLVPLWDPAVAADEVRRLAAKGVHSITFTENPATLGYDSFHNDSWDPLWAACSDEGVVVSIHLGSSGQLAVTAPDAPIDVMITLQPMNICQAAADLLWSRIPKQFPDIRIALSEGGTGWIPYFLDRLDRTYDMHHLWTGQDFGDRLPSDVFRHHFLTCFISDPVGVQLRHMIGIDNIAWECDYPHSDSSWPEAPEELAAVLAADDVPDDEVEQDHPRERHALVLVRPVRAPPAGAVHRRRPAGRGRRLGRVRPARTTRAASRSATPAPTSASWPSRPPPEPRCGPAPTAYGRGMASVSTARVLILGADDVEDMELLYPLFRLREEEAAVTLATLDGAPVRGKKGYGPIEPDTATDAVRADDFDALVIPGGYTPDKLRRHDHVLDLVRAFDRDAKPIAFICHAGWVPISAGILKGRRATSVAAIRDDMVNAGVDWVDEATVVDGNLISARTPADLGPWMRALLAALS